MELRENSGKYVGQLLLQQEKCFSERPTAAQQVFCKSLSYLLHTHTQKKHEHSELHILKALGQGERVETAGSVQDKPMSHQRVQWWVFRFEEIIKRSGKVEGDRREKREQSAPRHALAITPGWHADPNFPARCSTSHHIRPFQVLPRLPLPWCHTGSGTTPKAEDTLTRERAQTTCTNAQRYIRGTQREIKSTASQEGTSS